MSFLQLENRPVVVFGLANRKSVACAIGKVLREAGALVVHVVRTPERAQAAARLFPESPVVICDVTQEANIERACKEIAAHIQTPLAGVVHSIAYANYSQGMVPFHQTRQQDFLQAMQISCYSFIAIANHCRHLMDPDGAMLTVSISTTRMAAENYGYMAPVKAALESSLVFLAKSFSAFSRIRFNAVCPSLLKTSASAGIPGYVDSFLFAEKVIPRKKPLQTSEVADVAAFLLSPRSSGINGQCVVVDAGMGFNYFDREIIAAVVNGGGSQ